MYTRIVWNTYRQHLSETFFLNCYRLHTTSDTSNMNNSPMHTWLCIGFSIILKYFRKNTLTFCVFLSVKWEDYSFLPCKRGGGGSNLYTLFPVQRAWGLTQKVANSKEELPMKKQQIKIINQMLQQGKNTTEISVTLDIPSSTIRAHLRRHPEFYSGRSCRNCGKAMVQPVGRKEKHFCSDKCRMAWWNSHREQIQKKAYYHLTCAYCGKEFESYGKRDRKFCCRDCYDQSRRHRTSA